jgi:LmbE family N-acetylglucosaminyl deacetylase
MSRDEAAIKNSLRRAAHAAAHLVLRARAESLNPLTPGTTLVIAPHQDDDVLGCGGLITLRRLAGRDVQVIYVTDGSASHPDHPAVTPPALAVRRATEARAALRVLGVESPAIHFLGAVDGRLGHLSPTEKTALAEKLEQCLRQIRPTEILLPSGDDGSNEHEAAFRLFQRAYAASGVRARVREFPIWASWSPRLLWRKLLRGQRVSRCAFPGYEFLKADALAQHRSQTEPTPPWSQPVLRPSFRRMFLAPEEFFFDI